MIHLSCVKNLRAINFHQRFTKLILVGEVHRRRKKAKAVTAVWGREFIQFLASLAVLH